MKKKTVVSAIFLLGLLSSPAVFSATSTATMTNTVNVVQNCSVTTIGFTTSYNSLSSSATTPTATITTTCTLGTNYKITLDQGANAAVGSTSVSPLRRVAKSGTPITYLSYNLYQDSVYSVVWGDTAASSPAAFTGSNNPQVVTVYVSIAGQQAVSSGTYTDTVLVTVTF